MKILHSITTKGFFSFGSIYAAKFCNGEIVGLMIECSFFQFTSKFFLMYYYDAHLYIFTN